MKFTDSQKREWTFAVNVGTMAAVKRETGVDLANTLRQNSTVVEDILGDVAVFFDVLTTLLKGQIKEAGITLEEFGEGLNNEDVVLEATKALIESILDFFPADRSGPMKKAFRKLWEVTERKAKAKAKAGLVKLDDLDFEAMADQAIKQVETSMSGDSSSDSRDTVE